MISKLSIRSRAGNVNNGTFLGKLIESFPRLEKKIMKENLMSLWIVLSYYVLMVNKTMIKLSLMCAENMV